MCLLLREAMSVGRIAISHHFFSIELEMPEARKRIKDELSSYCVVTEAPKSTFGKVCASAMTHTHTRARFFLTTRLCILGSQNIHGQALRQAGRSVHCDPAGHDWLSKIVSFFTCFSLSLSHAFFPCATLLRSFQDPKYRNFRVEDYLTPQGLANGPIGLRA
jgi:hypothetical protein